MQENQPGSSTVQGIYGAVFQRHNFLARGGGSTGREEAYLVSNVKFWLVEMEEEWMYGGRVSWTSSVSCSC